MRNSAQPVAVITTLLPQHQKVSIRPKSSHVHGATLSSFTTVSLDPPLVAFSLRTPSRLADALDSTGNLARGPHFIVNVLSTKQEIEAAGFSKPGLEPFSLESDWTSQEASSGPNNDTKHPLSTAPFHPSTIAKDDSGVFVPVLSNSLGSLACSVVSKVSLKDLEEGAKDIDIEAGSDSNQGGSELFLARVHGVEYTGKLEDEGEKRLPMVYWDQKFTSIVR